MTELHQSALNTYIRQCLGRYDVGVGGGGGVQGGVQQASIQELPWSALTLPLRGCGGKSQEGSGWGRGVRRGGGGKGGLPG